MNLRVLPVGLAALALFVGLAVAASAILGYRQGGPLGVRDHAGVIWPAAVGDEFTWAMPLDNHTGSDIVLESIAPHGVSGLEVVGVLASDQGCEVHRSPKASLPLPSRQSTQTAPYLPGPGSARCKR